MCVCAQYRFARFCAHTSPVCPLSLYCCLKMDELMTINQININTELFFISMVSQRGFNAKNVENVVHLSTWSNYFKQSHMSWCKWQKLSGNVYILWLNRMWFFYKFNLKYFKLIKIPHLCLRWIYWLWLRNEHLNVMEWFYVSLFKLRNQWQPFWS